MSLGLICYVVKKHLKHKKKRQNKKRIYKKTQIKNIKNSIIKLKLNWADHIIRLKDERWTKIITEWWPIKRERKTRRQLKRWNDEFKKIADNEWTRIAKRRSKWKKLGKVYARNGPGTI